MPIYGYVCRGCGHRFDVLQKISDDPLVHCPDCGEPSLQKELSAPKFRLKGSGWYETDFKTGDKRNLHGGDSDSKSGGSSKAPETKSSETKSSESKSDSKAKTD